MSTWSYFTSHMYTEYQVWQLRYGYKNDFEQNFLSRHRSVLVQKCKEEVVYKIHFLLNELTLKGMDSIQVSVMESATTLATYLINICM